MVTKEEVLSKYPQSLVAFFGWGLKNPVCFIVFIEGAHKIVSVPVATF